MYVGPHRASRRQQVHFRFLGPEISMRNIYEGDGLPGFEGIRHISGQRSPWDHDDAPTFLKYSLCQIELDRREAIAQRYDKERSIEKDSLPEVWEPLRALAQNLLPHLTFEKIDTSNRDQIQCYWKVHNLAQLVDIDDLSSGEKSVIQLFYPLIEHRIKGVLRKLKGEEIMMQPESICVLMDEPELHLHPVLQTKVLDYLRRISVQENTQFILATHSQTIVENATSEELHLLRPAELVESSENQLIPIATSSERLELIRNVFGVTSNLTAMRPILVVEGRKSDKSAARARDARIYSFLSDEFTRLTILPGGGKAECYSLIDSINEIFREFSGQLRAHALLDRDLEETDVIADHVHLLPVSMVENLLLDPLVIWEATTVVHHKMKLESPADIDRALNEILNEREEFEISRRIKAQVGARIFRLKDPVKNASQQIEDFFKELRDALAPDKIHRLTQECTSMVEQIKTTSKRREFFDGKKVLREFFKMHMHDSGMSEEIFIYECARKSKERKSVKSFVESLMMKLGLRKD